MRAIIVMLAAFALHGAAAAAPMYGISKKLVTYTQPVIALTHASVIDGTGAAPIRDQTLVMKDGRIAALGPAATTAVPAGALVIDATGKTLIPGLVMVHEHLFYPSTTDYQEFPLSFVHLYLAGGETTIRTAGSMAPVADINIARDIAEGRLIGPDIDVTGPYLDAGDIFSPKMMALKDAADAERTVDYWAAEGVTSFKAYIGISRAELAAAVKAAHAHGLKITGHLCSVTYGEAAALGIDNLEHGFAVMTDFVADKKPDICPDFDAQQKSVELLDPASAPVQALFRTLIAHHVAVTSTLPVFESTAQGRPGASKEALALLTPELQASYATKRMDYLTGGKVRSEAAYFANTMRLEKAFADAGGTLLAGTDPTGLGGVLPGYAGKREIELLVEEGFTVPHAIRIATLTGATYLGRDKDVGSLAVGKRADVVVIDGDLAADVHAIEAMPLVFKAGVGMLTKPMFDRFKGQVGLY